MTVDEYVEFKQDQLNRFQEFWEKEQAEKPEQYPEDIENVSDWDDQFNAWQTVYEEE